MQTKLIQVIGLSILALTFALLALGHKTRLNHESAMNINGVMSIVYELAALATIADVLTTIF